MMVKVCGMTRADNIRDIEALGIDWMGFIFYPKSPRCVSSLPSYLPQQARRVGVFVNASPSDIAEADSLWHFDLLQLHGQETPETCSYWQGRGKQVIKAFSIATAEDLTATARYAGTCDYYLFDTKTPAYGGSGQCFDWHLLQAYRGDTPFLLSGGIDPDSAQALLHFSHPQWAGIDLNSRFETSPGVKDPERIRQLLEQLRMKNEE